VSSAGIEGQLGYVKSVCGLDDGAVGELDSYAIGCGAFVETVAGDF
jgi:hypothetical protein